MAWALGLWTTGYLFFFFFSSQTNIIVYHRNHRAFSLQASSSFEMARDQFSIFRKQAISTELRACLQAVASSTPNPVKQDSLKLCRNLIH